VLRLGIFVFKEAGTVIIVVLYIPEVPIILSHFLRNVLVLFRRKHAFLSIELLKFRVFLQLVCFSSFGAHLVDCVDTTFHVGAAQIVHLQSKLHHGGEFRNVFVAEIFKAHEMNWVSLLVWVFDAVSEKDIVVFANLISLMLDPPGPPLGVLLGDIKLKYSAVRHRLGQGSE